MAENEAIEISPSSSDEERKPLMRTDESSPLSVSPIVCLKRKIDMKRYEETEDCFILDFDPSESIGRISKLSFSDDVAGGISIISEKGQVACRDYPHSRHLCLKFPFGATPSETHCELCYCYVCDSLAPCGHWTESPSPHCRAWGASKDWESKRRNMRERRSVAHK